MVLSQFEMVTIATDTQAETHRAATADWLAREAQAQHQAMTDMALDACRLRTAGRRLPRLLTRRPAATALQS